MKKFVIFSIALCLVLFSIALTQLVLVQGRDLGKICSGKSEKVCSALPMCKPLYSGGQQCDTKYCWGILPLKYIGCTSKRQVLPTKNKSVIVAIDTTKGTKQDLLNSIKSGYYKVYYEYDTLPGFAMHVDSEVYAFLQKSDLVKSIGEDKLSEPLN